MNHNTHRTIFNRKRVCLMPVAETAKSSGKASGSVRSRSKSKSKTPTCRKARSALSSANLWLQANNREGYSRPCLQGSFSSALSRSQYKGYAASLLGSDPVAPLLAFGRTPLAVGVRPQKFPASQNQGGNVILEAAKVEATNNLNVSATNGVVALLSATSQSYVQTDKKESNVAVQRNSGSGSFDKNVVTTQLKYGTLSIDTNKIIADLPASKAADELAKQPGMGWINDIKNDPALAGKIDWKQIDEAHKNWAYDKTSMTPAMAAIVSLAVAYASGGTLSNLAAGAAGSMGVGAAMTVALQAGMSGLLSQASVALINNGGDLGKTFQQLDSSESLKGLALSMVTAGALQGLSDYLPRDLATATAKSPFTDQLSRNLINNAAAASIRSALTGTSLEENLKSSIVDAIITTGMAQGANSVGDAASKNVFGEGKINEFGRAVAHAVAGCIAGAAKAQSGDGCSAGAVGAVVGELAASFYNSDTGDGTGKPKADTTAFAALMSGMAGALVGGDAKSVNLAASTGANAAANNYLLHPDRTALNAAKVKLSASIADCNLACKDAAQKEVTRLEALDKANDDKWKAACDANPSSPDCTSQLKYKTLDLEYQNQLAKAPPTGAATSIPTNANADLKKCATAECAAGLLPVSNGGVRSSEDIAKDMANINRGAGIVSSSATAAAAVPGPHQPVAAGVALGATVVGVVADGVQQIAQPSVGAGIANVYTAIASGFVDNKLPLVAPLTNEVVDLWKKSGTNQSLEAWANSNWQNFINSRNSK